MGANSEIVGEFKIQEDVKMHIQLPDYYDFRGFGSPNETDLAAIANRLYGRFAKPSCPTLKLHLFIAYIPKNTR